MAKITRGCITALLAAMAMITQPFPAMAQGKPVTAAALEVVKAGIREAAEKTITISSDFVQEKQMSMIKEKIVSKGRFYFKRERKLRWEYVQPYAYLIIIKDDQISVRDDGKVSQFSIQSNKVFREVNRIILGSIRGTLLSDDKNFRFGCFETAGSWIIRLKPFSAGTRESLSEIVIWFDRKDYSVNHIELNEPGGDCTRINFTDRKTNQPVGDEMFLLP
ncbi:MAG: outer membrane lipoprotein carrier protein LolA [Bacteroidota bacterium]